MTLLAFTLQQENSATMTMNVTAEGKDLDSSSHVLNKGEYNRKNVGFFYHESPVLPAKLRS